MSKVFVFGSNSAGIHGAGAAKFAYQKQGARWGKGYGHHGESFAIPTKDEYIKTLPITRIKQYVEGFIAYATDHPKVDFQVTCIGCGLASLAHKDVAVLFKNAPKNCSFDTRWKPYLGDKFTYWGTF